MMKDETVYQDSYEVAYKALKGDKTWMNQILLLAGPLHPSLHSISSLHDLVQSQDVFTEHMDRICAITNVLKLHKIIWKYNPSDWCACMGSVTPADISLDYIVIADWTLVEQEGGIVLTHELNNFAMSEVVKFYPQLQAAFSHIVLVGIALKSRGYISSTTNKTGGSNGSSSTGSCSSNKNSSSSSDAQEKSVTAASLAALVLLLAGAGMGLLASLMLRAATLDMVT
ncbi:hypothetical protein EVG20_g3982 [Dentipellis fragilis]|uniref:Uncharacterized protein n=1 Tax=Dentipellis fragilis TaxID=205917 RepID=A0A4Y9Z005_9AGAM|nr:hypothetical protein EVG20_g3982 [Dentipellis fragilis]